MAISTYAELKTAVANWLNRSDLTSRVPEFIAIGEAVIAGDPDPLDPEALPGVRCRAQEKRVTASISTRYVDQPTDMLEMRNIQLNASSIRALKFRTPEQIDNEYDSSATGTPETFTLIGDEIQFAPSPDATYTAELAYTARFAAFSADADYNWLLTNHPNVYLYAALIAAEPYLKNDDRAMTWAAQYKAAVRSLNRAEKKALFSGSALQMRSDVADIEWAQ